MNDNQSGAPLRFVIGAAIGTLLGLCFLEVSVWIIPVGSLVGGIVGLATASTSSGSLRPFDDGSTVEGDLDGCARIGCMGSPYYWSSWLGCLPSLVVLFVVVFVAAR